jgi:hypothetical protein
LITPEIAFLVMSWLIRSKDSPFGRISNRSARTDRGVDDAPALDERALGVTHVLEYAHAAARLEPATRVSYGAMHFRHVGKERALARSVHPLARHEVQARAPRPARER